jgi:hypothetical protein
MNHVALQFIELLKIQCNWEKNHSTPFPTDMFIWSIGLSGVLQGQVDQLEDRYLGMVEASGSNPDLSISF